LETEEITRVACEVHCFLVFGDLVPEVIDAIERHDSGWAAEKNMTEAPRTGPSALILLIAGF
jgi:hypothetical protein